MTGSRALTGRRSIVVVDGFGVPFVCSGTVELVEEGLLDVDTL